MNFLSVFLHAVSNASANASYMAKVPVKEWEVYSTYYETRTQVWKYKTVTGKWTTESTYGTLHACFYYYGNHGSSFLTE